MIDVFFSTNGEQLIVVTADELSIWQFGEQILTRVQRIDLEGPGILDTDLSPTGNSACIRPPGWDRMASDASQWAASRPFERESGRHVRCGIHPRWHPPGKSCSGWNGKPVANILAWALARSM